MRGEGEGGRGRGGGREGLVLGRREPCLWVIHCCRGNLACLTPVVDDITSHDCPLTRRDSLLEPKDSSHSDQRNNVYVCARQENVCRCCMCARGARGRLCGGCVCDKTERTFACEAVCPECPLIKTRRGGNTTMRHIPISALHPSAAGTLRHDKSLGPTPTKSPNLFRPRGLYSGPYAGPKKY